MSGDETHDELIRYRVEQLESAVEQIVESNIRMNDAIIEFKIFATELKTWMKVIAAIWGLLVVVIAAVLVKMLVG